MLGLGLGMGLRILNPGRVDERNALATFPFTRASVAWGWDSQPLLQEHAVNEPVREYDPGTGVYLGLRAEESRTYSLLDNRDMTTGNWAQVPGTMVTRSSSETGVDGTANSAMLLNGGTDSNVRMRQNLSVNNDSARYYVSCALKKNQSDSVRLQALFSGGTSVRAQVDVNTNDGSTSLIGDNGGVTDVEDVGNWWIVTIAPTNNSSGNTTLSYDIYPDTSGSSQDCIFDFGQIEIDANFRSSPYEVGGSSATRAEDVIEKSITDAGNGFLVEGTYGGGTGVTVRQLDDGTTDNRIRLYVDSNQKMLFQIRTGGVDQCSIDTGSIAEGDGFKVAPDYTDGNVSVSRDGNAAQTATATIPTVTMDRYARNHQETTGRFWFIESNCYVFATERTDSQLEALSA